MSSLYSWARFGTRTAAAAAGLRTGPTKLIFVVTKRCHSQCVYCDIWKAKDQPGGLDGELSPEEVRQLARNNPGLQWIDFTGGEPTDRPDFVELVREFDRCNPDLLMVHFPTNGIATKRISEISRQLRDSLAARLVVTVSIDGPPEINDRLRGIRNDFSHAIATFVSVRKLLGAGNAYVGMTLHGHSRSCGRSTRDLMCDTFGAINAQLASQGEPPIGWGQFHLNIPHFSQHYYGNGESQGQSGFGDPQHRSEIAEALTHASSQAGEGPLGLRLLERIYRREADVYLKSGKTGIHCAALLSTAYLSEKGVLYPCSIWDKPLGNVRDTEFRLQPLLDKAWRDGVRAAAAEGRCPNCWTPCEAYPAILASPFKSALRLIKP